MIDITVLELSATFTYGITRPNSILSVVNGNEIGPHLVNVIQVSKTFILLIRIFILLFAHFEQVGRPL